MINIIHKMLDNKNNNNIQNKNQKNESLVPYNHSENELLLNPEMNYKENPLHLIGPLYIAGGVVGIFFGIISGYWLIHYYFPKIIRNNTNIKISKFISEIINHSNHLSNTFGGFGLINYFISKSIDLMMYEAKII